MIKINKEFNYLKQMRQLIAVDMQLDNFSRIDNFFRETGLNSSFIYAWIEKEYCEAVNRKVLPQEKFSFITKQYINHLDGRICRLGVYLLLHEEKVERSACSKIREISDIWMAGMRKNAPKAEELLYASMHVQDILFGCKIVLEGIPEKAFPFFEKELIPFIHNTLPAYLAFLPEKDQRSEIQQCFEALENAISFNQADSAKEKLYAAQTLVNFAKSAS